MFDPISSRATFVLRVLATGESLSRAAIAEAVGERRSTTVRELSRLVDLGYVATAGDARATTYRLTDKARKLVLWDTEYYLAEEPDRRHARYTRIQPELFGEVSGSIGKPNTILTDAILVRRRLGDRITTLRDLERFVIDLSWKSSNLEGNTYTLLDTERLIAEGIEAPGHVHTEAVMILNHKRAFEYIWQHQADFRQLTRAGLEEVHALLTAGLDLSRGLRTGPVGITDTVYVPPASKTEIASCLAAILEVINSCAQPVEKALGCLVLLPYLQPFADGNMRTSRLVANAVLLAYGYPPLSYHSVDEQTYKGTLILFYEQGTVANFRQLFLQQLEESAMNYFTDLVRVLDERPLPGIGHEIRHL